MATFGYTGMGVNIDNTENEITGNLATPLQNGRANSIIAYIQPTGVGKMKCALYNHDTLAFVAGTNENIFAGAGAAHWETFLFPVKPLVIAGQAYIIVMWWNANNNKYYDPAPPNTWHRRNQVYNGWIDPYIVDGHGAWQLSIYCDYTPISAKSVTLQAARLNKICMTPRIEGFLQSLAKGVYKGKNSIT